MALVRRTWCNIIAGIFSLFIVAPFTFMMLDRHLPVSLNNGNIIPNEVIRGGTAKISWRANIHRRCDGTYIRRMTDHSGFTYDTLPATAESFFLMGDKDEGVFEKEFTIPSMLPGPAKYQVIVTYWCNPLQKYLWPIVHIEEPVYFTVVNPPLITGPTGPTGPQGIQGKQGVQGEQGEQGP